ncbi:hypothetical protein BDR03DRAFT_952185, partial [Suillus americanus]
MSKVFPFHSNTSLFLYSLLYLIDTHIIVFLQVSTSRLIHIPLLSWSLSRVPLFFLSVFAV